MPSEPIPDPLVGGAEAETVNGLSQSGTPDALELPGELSEFSQRLASFGLGETPDPLLTEAQPPVKRRTRQ